MGTGRIASRRLKQRPVVEQGRLHRLGAAPEFVEERITLPLAATVSLRLGERLRHLAVSSAAASTERSPTSGTTTVTVRPPRLIPVPLQVYGLPAKIPASLPTERP